MNNQTASQRKQPIGPHLQHTIKSLYTSKEEKKLMIGQLETCTFDVALFEVRIPYPSRKNLPPIVQQGSVLIELVTAAREEYRSKSPNSPDNAPIYVFIRCGDLQTALVPADVVSIINYQSWPHHVPEYWFGI